MARQWNRSRLRESVLRRAGVSPAHKTPSGWEHFFLQGRWAYVRATLKDGRVVGGWFGPNSFAGYTAETPDLYLEQRERNRLRRVLRGGRTDFHAKMVAPDMA